ncbi:hypothetical protein P4H27_10035 [Paenibacillus taichungensis]|uniref:XkdQ/YqbQ family protein n=1 Tax=Paenibacillus taichungensis TaxID=484184 RepID=UPI002DB9F388|nr:hypothetical protein [Paenibacillus taichungensis]MEC0107275.1 hypothetical protein [Paenibacillus taichungensis]MEC0194793.1 hypothetical protein [Paenibacillus taichungensis]
MGHQVILFKDGKKLNVTQFVGNLAWSSNMEALGEELSFDYAYNDTTFFEKGDLIEAGSQLALFNNSKFLNYYIVVSSSLSGRFGKSFSCFDRSWYLNKNKTIVQFKKASASQSIGKLLDRFGIKHNIVSIPTLITKIYKEETVSDIIADILDQAQQETGKRYYMEMIRDVLYVRQLTDLVINPITRLSSNTYEFPVTATISNPNRELSIEDMRNRVIVVAQEDASTKIYATSEDKTSITKYGQLSEVITVESKNAAQARNIASKKLKELNRVGETVSCDLIGHDDIRAGRMLDLNEPVTGIVGRFLIKSASHTVTNGNHKVSVELEAV